MRIEQLDLMIELISSAVTCEFTELINIAVQLNHMVID